MNADFLNERKMAYIHLQMDQNSFFSISNNLHTRLYHLIRIFSKCPSNISACEVSTPTEKYMKYVFLIVSEAELSTWMTQRTVDVLQFKIPP